MRVAWLLFMIAGAVYCAIKAGGRRGRIYYGVTALVLAGLTIFVTVS